MNSEKLVELMHDYLNQYGYMSGFLDYCEDEEDFNREEISQAIEKIVYGG